MCLTLVELRLIVPNSADFLEVTHLEVSCIRISDSRFGSEG